MAMLLVWKSCFPAHEQQMAVLTTSNGHQAKRYNVTNTPRLSLLKHSETLRIYLAD